MKKAFLFFVITLLTLSASAQGRFVAVGVDPSNLLVGSKHNDPALDVQVRFYGQQDGLEIGIQAEQFQAIEYSNFLFDVGYYKNFKRIQAATYVETGMIIREMKYSYLTYGLNAELRYKLTHKLGAYIKANLQHRPDLQGEIYARYSTYTGLNIQF
jgi:hypothetical protein